MAERPSAHTGHSIQSCGGSCLLGRQDRLSRMGFDHGSARSRGNQLGHATPGFCTGERPLPRASPRLVRAPQRVDRPFHPVPGWRLPACARGPVVGWGGDHGFARNRDHQRVQTTPASCTG